ncbi:hypothetical protein GQS40_08945|uniref:Mur ligase N-terminal catalytic domain-containing protein n=1 Tax=Leuconostoc lactis TaxID=1246 RepID=A0A6L7A753_LEULA|nr:hypothetical protein [Leuconostoc lactis]
MAKTYYFIGIKGTGMGPLAQILHDQGHVVLGSDIETYTYTQAPLEAAGIEISVLPEDFGEVGTVFDFDKAQNLYTDHLVDTNY